MRVIHRQTSVRTSRLRRTPALRRLLRETQLDPHQLIQPIFVAERESDCGVIDSLPGVERVSVDSLPALVRELHDSGVGGVLLFGIPAHKDDVGSSADDPTGVIPGAIDAIKSAQTDVVVITDVCLCQYTDHGHCGVLDGHEIDETATRQRCARIALAHANAGADLVAPSGMIDGAVREIRAALDTSGHDATGILSYAAKFASSLYGPFRDAAASQPSFGDRRTHQLDPANSREAVRTALQHAEEGADILMVKPAGAYLDVIAHLRSATDLPLAAYQVSGEYAMIEAAASRGWLDRDAAVLELLTSIRRAGADLIITYYAGRIARHLTHGVTA